MKRLLLVLALPGCGLGITGESHGGGDNLPTLGAGPYGRLEPDFDTPASEPFVIEARDVSYEGAAALRRGDGGLRLWFGMRADDGEPVIAAAEVLDVHVGPDVPPHEVLAALPDWEWENGRVTNPAVIEVGEALVMFYEAGTDAPVIGRAVSTDDGATWTRGAVPVLEGAASPTAAYVDGAYVLYVTRPDRDGIWRADSDDDGETFTFDDAPAIVPRPGVTDAFDTRTVGDPYLLVETSDAGRQHWGLWFTGSADAPDAGPAPTAVGYAGSLDGETWERFGGVDPVLTAPAGSPCVLLDGGSGLMLYHEEQRLHLGIAAAVHP
jgi:hypothetical protein